MALYATKNLFMKEKKKSIDTANFTVVLFQEIATATATFSNHHPDHSSTISIKVKPSISKNYDSLKAQMIVRLFSNTVF